MCRRGRLDRRLDGGEDGGIVPLHRYHHGGDTRVHLEEDHGVQDVSWRLWALRTRTSVPTIDTPAPTSRSPVPRLD